MEKDHISPAQLYYNTHDPLFDLRIHADNIFSFRYKEFFDGKKLETFRSLYNRFECALNDLFTEEEIQEEEYRQALNDSFTSSEL